MTSSSTSFAQELKPPALSRRLRNVVRGRKRLPLVAALGLALCIQPAAQASGPTEHFCALMDTLLAGCYAAADSICSRISSEHPGHPAALWAQGTVLYTHLIDSEDSTRQAELFALSDSCARLCARWRDARRDDSALLAYLRGNALSSAGVILMRSGRLLPGMQKLLSARQEFDAALDSDPLLYDAYLGRGTYRCALAQNASLLSVLPFVPDFETGLRDLQLAADSAVWSRWVALNALAWFTLNEGNYDLADSLCDVGLARFPGSRAFLQPKLAVHVRQDHWAEAERIGLRLLTAHLADSQGNGYETTTLYWRLMVCADNLGRPEDAEGYARAGLGMRRTTDVERRRKEKIEAMRERLALGSARAGGDNGGR